MAQTDCLHHAVFIPILFCFVLRLIRKSSSEALSLCSLIVCTCEGGHSSSQASYRSFPRLSKACPRENSLAPLLLLSPKSFQLFGDPVLKTPFSPSVDSAVARQGRKNVEKRKYKQTSYIFRSVIIQGASFNVRTLLTYLNKIFALFFA